MSEEHERNILDELLDQLGRMPKFDRGISWQLRNWQGAEEMTVYGETARCLKWIFDNTEALIYALAPQGDNAEEPVGYCIWISPTKLAACTKRTAGSFPVYTHPCTSTLVVSQNAPALEDKEKALSDAEFHAGKMAQRDSFLTTTAGDGKPYVKITFQCLEDVHLFVDGLRGLRAWYDSRAALSTSPEDSDNG